MNFNFRTYKPTPTTKVPSSNSKIKLKTYQELLDENKQRKQKEQEMQTYLDNLYKYQEYLKQDAIYKEQLAKQQAEEQAREEAKKGKNFFQRAGQTIGDLFARVGGGALGGIEKINQGIGNIAEGLNKNANKSNLPSNLQSGFQPSEGVRPNYNIGGTLSDDILNYAESLNASYWRDLSPKGQEIAYGVMQGVGEMLPSIGFTLASGGAGGVGLVPLSMQAFGGASEQALQEGANYGEAYAYGVLNAGVEVLTEKLVGGATGKLTGTGKGLLDSAIKKAATSKLIQTGLDIIGEGVEEAISETLDPILKRITYDDKALEKFLTKEHGEEILQSAIIGSLTSMVFEGANVVIQKGTNADTAEIISKYEDIVKMEQAAMQDGSLSQEQLNELAKIKKELEAQMQLKLDKLDPRQRMNLASKFGDSTLLQNYNPFEQGSELVKKKTSDNVIDTTTTTKPIETTTKEEVKVDFNEKQQANIEKAKKLHETFKKVNSNIGELVFDTNLNDNVNGFYDKNTNKLHINPNIDNAYSQVLTHELTHSLEGSKGYNDLQMYALSYLKKTGEYDTLRKDLEELYRSNGLLEGMSKKEVDNYMDEEIMAKFSERLFNSEESIKNLVNENRSLARKILNWVREKLALLKGNLTKEELELRKELRKIEELYKKALAEPKVAKETTKTDFRENYNKKIKNKHKKFSLNEEQHKKKQFEIISKLNPMRDDYHVGIRSVEDIKTFKEVLNDEESFVWGDFSKEDAIKAEKLGHIKVYSSKDIINGSFVSTSYNQALEYAGRNKNNVKSKVVSIYDVAWINGDEGMMAKVDLDDNKKFSLTKDSKNKQTIINATSSYFNQEAQDMLKTDSLTYEVSTNKETVEKARQELKGTKLETQIEKTLLELEKVFKATKDNEVLVAKATLLMQEANKKGLNAHVNDLATSISATLTQMGKATQAGSIIQRLSPEGRLIAYQKTINLENEKIKAQKGVYLNKKGFKTISKERMEKWFNTDLNVIKKRATLTFIENNQDIVKLTQEQVNRLNKLTTSSESYTNNVINVFEQALPNDLQLAKELGTNYANEVLEQEKLLKERYETSPILIPEVLVAQLANAKGESNIKEITKKIEEVINSQKTATMFEKLMQWRYLAMLGNPKTHIRNILSNKVMGLIVDARNNVSRMLQSTLIKDKTKRTRTFQKASATTTLFAQEHAEAVYKELAEKTTKFVEANKNKRIFNNKLLEQVRKFNYLLLEGEDAKSSKARFVKELSEWITAKGYSVEELKAKPELLNEGSKYALLQAEKATFKDACVVATLLNKFKAQSKLAELALGAVMPFTKTPINVARRGFEYSPAGLIKNLTYDISKLNKGEITINEYLDKLSEGLTGSAITIIGLMLAKMGILSGGDDESKKVSNFEKAIGEQPYSIRIGDKTYTLDWLAPASIPLFTGVALYEDLAKKDADDNVIYSIAGAFSASLDPLTEMSFLKSFNSIMSSYDDNKLEGYIWSSMESFAAQFLPTLGSQIAKIIDPIRRTTSTTGKTSYKKKIDRSTNYLISKIPFLSKQLEPYVNVWGEVEENANFLDRLLENTAYPFWISKNKPDFVDEEILRLYTKNGNIEVLPNIPNSYYTKDGERIDMTPEEYTDFKIKVGTFAKSQLEEIFTSQFYKEIDDEKKEKIIKKVYDISREYAKGNLTKEYLVYTALGKKNQDKYAKYLVELDLIEGIKDEQGNTIKDSRKNNVVMYIQAQNLKKEQKYLLLALAGYKNNINNKQDIINYVNSLDLSEEQKQELLKIYNF